MTTTTELIEYLKGFPPDTPVKVLAFVREAYRDTYTWIDPELEPYGMGIEEIGGTIYIGEE